MIKSVKNFFTEEQCKFFIDCFDNNVENSFEVKDKVYSFNAVNIITLNIDYKEIAPVLNATYHKNRLRVQLINPGFDVNKNFHGHSTENRDSFIVFLNADYRGGELEFETGEIIKPEVGTLVKFQYNDKHRVNPVLGNGRYTLVGLLSSTDENEVLGFRKDFTLLE